MSERNRPVVNAELGTKRTCPNCATRFYDLLKDPITCPKCSTSFVAMAILPSKTDFPGAVPPPAPKPRVNEEEVDDNQEVELVSLEDAEEPDKADDETAGIEDVDLGEDAADGDEEEDDTFLVEEEEEGGNLSDLVEGGGKEDEEES
jgi:uncharacterized protein (TIGR02300 family)